MASKPIQRNSKPGWEEQHQMFVDIAANTKQELLLIGDSIVSELSRYGKVWSKYFEPLQALNFGIGGDRTQNVLWRLKNGKIHKKLQTAIIYCGTNNINKNDPEDIKTAILSITYFILEKKPQADVIITDLLPRNKEISHRRKRIQIVNKKIENWNQENKIANVKFLKPDTDWVDENRLLSVNLYFHDFLHLNEKRNIKFAKKIVNSLHIHKHVSPHTTLSIPSTQSTAHPTTTLTTPSTPTPTPTLAAPSALAHHHLHPLSHQFLQFYLHLPAQQPSIPTPSNPIHIPISTSTNFYNPIVTIVLIFTETCLSISLSTPIHSHNTYQYCVKHTFNPNSKNNSIPKPTNTFNPQLINIPIPRFHI